MFTPSNPRPQVVPEPREAARSVIFGQEEEHGGEARPREPLGPIGPERLRALREAIRNGTYPTDEHVIGGLERMLARDEPGA